jgi:dTDP-4-amino-4,6-dideoxygalactose transaminase
MRRLEAFIARRREIARRFTAAFSSRPELRLPAVSPGVEPGWHLYVLRTQGKASLRRPFFEALRRHGILPQVHYLPVYLHPYYRELGYRPGLCPLAEDFYQRAVSIPLFPRMTDSEVDRVIEAVLACCDEVLQ